MTNENHPLGVAQSPVVWRVRYCGQWMYFEEKANAEIYAQEDDNTEPLYAAQPPAAPVETDALQEAIRGAVARGWCSRANEHKEMDADLASSIFEEVWTEVAAHLPACRSSAVTGGQDA